MIPDLGGRQTGPQSFILLNGELFWAMRYRSRVAQNFILKVLTHEGTLIAIRRVGNLQAIGLNLQLIFFGTVFLREILYQYIAEDLALAINSWVFVVMGLILFFQTVVNTIAYTIGVYPVVVIRNMNRLKIVEQRRNIPQSLATKIRHICDLVVASIDINSFHLFFMSITALLADLAVIGQTPLAFLLPWVVPPSMKYLFALHLLDIIVQFKLFLTIVRSITKNWASIALTTALLCLVVYYYALFSMVFLSHLYYVEVDYGGDDAIPACYDVLSCFMTLIGQMPSGGDYMRKVMNQLGQSSEVQYVSGILIQMSFFFIALILILNILFGIIVDTFSQMRAEKKAIQDDANSRCFICSIDATTFDREGDGFEYHTREEHRTWDYTHFQAFVLEKSSRVGELSLSGPETAALLAYRKFPPDINIMPLGQASSVTKKT